MPPFLTFTAEEAWRVRGHFQQSIFVQTYQSLPAGNAALLEKWSRIRAVRDLVNKEIENVRTAGLVGASLQARVVLTAPPEDFELLQSLGEDLKYPFIGSRPNGKLRRGRRAAHRG